MKHLLLILSTFFSVIILFGENPSDCEQLYILGRVSINANKVDSAIYYFHKADSCYQITDNIEEYRLGLIYTNLADGYGRLEESRLSSKLVDKYFHKADSSIPQNRMEYRGYFFERKGDYYFGKAEFSDAIREYKSAFKNYKYYLDNNPITSSWHKRYFSMINNTAGSFNNLENVDSTIYYSLKGIKLIKKYVSSRGCLDEGTSFDKIILLLKDNYASGLMMRDENNGEDLLNAIKVYEEILYRCPEYELGINYGILLRKRKENSKALKILKKTIALAGIHTPKVYYNIAQVYFAQEKLDSAEQYYKEAILQNIQLEHKADIEKLNHVKYLYSLASVQKEKKDFDTSLNIYEEAIDSLSHFFKGLQNHTNKRKLKETIYTLYEGAISTALAIGDTARAFNFLKRGKGSLLYANMIHNSGNTEEKTGGKPLELLDIQGRLKNNNTSIVEYFVGQDSLFIFHLDGEKVQVFSKEWDHRLVQSFLDTFFQSAEDEPTEKYLKTAHLLYEYLELGNPSLHKRLVIIPDQELTKVPFEALLCKEIKSAENYKLPYLLYKHITSYAYSTNTYFQSKMESLGEYKTPIAFAPVLFEGTDLDSLGYSENELDSISLKVRFDIFKNNEATIENFYKYYPKAKVIHLSTHGIFDTLNSENSYLQFKPSEGSKNQGKLYLKDIYPLNLQSNLVVLSACDTHLGTVYDGEGMLSISQALFYAKVKSVLSTLWKMNDKSTAIIMTQFYHHLSEGKSKAEALTRAKIDYLQLEDLNREIEITTNPYFWAGPILIGDDEVLELEAPYSLPTRGIIFSVLALLILILIWKGRNSRKA